MYICKGKELTPSEKVNEFIGANLALQFGLPIPPFGLMNIPNEIIQYDNELKDSLGGGWVFASQYIENSQILTYNQISQVPSIIQRDILLFDCWVQNEDRTLTALGGNPNLLWENLNETLYVIDHNMILDAEWNEDNTKTLHPFKNQFTTRQPDMVDRLNYIQRFQKALSNWDYIISQIPKAWLNSKVESEILFNYDYLGDQVNQEKILGKLI